MKLSIAIAAAVLVASCGTAYADPVCTMYKEMAEASHKAMSAGMKRQELINVLNDYSDGVGGPGLRQSKIAFKIVAEMVYDDYSVKEIFDMCVEAHSKPKSRT